jgi:DNA polymerase III epsilon subunit-like protein
MSYFVVDVESDDQSPAVGSMVCFGAVKVSDLSTTFYGKTRPVMDAYNPEALAISGFSREDHEGFDDPKEVMLAFEKWVLENSDGKPVFISDNPAFDWQWINYYFHKYVGRNPFGFSARRIGDLYCGMVKHAGKNRDWKRKYRKTVHDHNPVNDAKGNAEALIAFRDELGLNIKF